MNVVDFIYSIIAGLFGGLVVLCYQIIYNSVKEKHWFIRLFAPAIISSLFLVIIIVLSLIFFN